MPWNRHGILACLNNTRRRPDASAADRLKSKRRPSRPYRASEIRLSVNWKHSATASSLRRVIGKEISRSSKIYKDTHEDKGAPLSMIGAGRWDDTKYASDWGNTVILAQTNSPFVWKVSSWQKWNASFVTFMNLFYLRINKKQEEVPAQLFFYSSFLSSFSYTEGSTCASGEPPKAHHTSF